MQCNLVSNLKFKTIFLISRLTSIILRISSWFRIVRITVNKGALKTQNNLKIIASYFIMLCRILMEEIYSNKFNEFL